MVWFQQRPSHKVSKSIIGPGAPPTRLSSFQTPLWETVFYTSSTSAQSSRHALARLTFSRPSSPSSSSSCFRQHRRAVLGTVLPSDVRLFRYFLGGGSRGLSHALVTEMVT